MIMKKLEKVYEDIFKKKRAIFEAAVPDLKELFHFIAQAQGIVCLYQARKNKEHPHDDTYYRNS